jgi:hypothetical protein
MLKEAFPVGARVQFARSHDKATKLFGHVVKIHDGNSDCVDIETEVDGKKVEVSGIETAHAADVSLAPALVPAKTSTAAPPATQQAGSRVIARG